MVIGVAVVVLGEGGVDFGGAGLNDAFHQEIDASDEDEETDEEGDEHTSDVLASFSVIGLELDEFLGDELGFGSGGVRIVIFGHRMLLTFNSAGKRAILFPGQYRR